MAGKVKLALVALASFLSITVFCFAENTQTQTCAAPKTGGSAACVKKENKKCNFRTRERPAKCDKVKKATWSGTCAKSKAADKEVKGVKKEEPKQNFQPLKTETKTERK